MKCRNASKIQDYLEKNLSEKDAAFLDAHIEMCAVCQDELRVMTRVFTELHTLKDSAFASPEHDFSHDIMRSIKSIQIQSVRQLSPASFMIALLLLDVFCVLLVGVENLNVLAGNGIRLLFYLLNTLQTVTNISLAVTAAAGAAVKNHVEKNTTFYIVVEMGLFVLCFFLALIKREKTTSLVKET